MKAAGWSIGAALFMSACAHLPTASDGLDLAGRRVRLAALPGWDMRGRIAVDTGERAFQARFRWLKQEDSLSLTVRGLLGAGSFEVRGDESALTLRARGESSTLTDPENDLSARFGWWLPVGSLDTWLVGLPDERYEARTRLDGDGRLVALEQRLWTVEYEDYRLVEDLSLPRTIDLKYESLELRLTVDAWNSVAVAGSALN